MDLDEIKRLLALMAEHDLVELELAEGDRKVRLRKAGDHAPIQAPVVVAAGGNSSLPASSAPAQAPSAAPPAPKPSDRLLEIRSPLVGTFYTSPKPGGPPFAGVGDLVGPEKVVCIVEAMKVMNEIKAELTGRIKEVVAKNGQPVEFGEVLFRIEKTE